MLLAEIIALAGDATRSRLSPATVILALASIPLGFSLCRALFSPLRDIPGPFLARFTDLWYLWRLYQGRFEEDNLALHKKYGPVIRLAPNRFSFADPAALRAIYGPGGTSGGPFPKSPSYRPAAPPDPARWTLFADEDVARHARHRRLYQSTYSMSSLVTYEAYVDECADLFALRLAELADARRPADLGRWLQCYAFDVVGLVTYSRRFGFLDRGDDVGSLIQTIDAEMVYFSLVGVHSWLHRFLFPLRNWLAGNQGTGRTYLMNFTKERIDEHQSRPASVSAEDAEAAEAPMDFLTKFFGKHAADPQTFTMTHVLAGCASNVVAGSDTTATSLAGIVYLLLKNPGCLGRLKEEIGQIRRGSDHGRISWTESQAMPYLQAVVKEALRLHTAVALPMERVVPLGGAVIGNHYFPPGEAIFGHDAGEFRPERWLTSDPERLSHINRNFISFGAGARTCIGRHIAYLQMSKLIPRLVADFDFELDPSIRQGPWHTRNYFFLKPTNFQVGIRQRHSE